MTLMQSVSMEIASAARTFEEGLCRALQYLVAVKDLHGLWAVRVRIGEWPWGFANVIEVLPAM